MEKIILASGSPRRKELMSLLPWDFYVKVENVEEKIDKNCSISENVQMLALKKAKAVAKKYPSQLVIGADTMVCLGEEMLGKPKNKEDAEKMLAMLSGKTHQVLSGVAIVCIDRGIEKVFYSSTKVSMAEISKEEIRQYVDSNEPLDKAGSYAIQGIGAKFIKNICGDYNNVVGLPICELYQQIKSIINDK